MVDTPFHAKYPNPQAPALIAAAAVGRAAAPEEVAGVVVFLARDASPFMTGEVVTVSGGR